MPHELKILSAMDFALGSRKSLYSLDYAKNMRG